MGMGKSGGDQNFFRLQKGGSKKNKAGIRGIRNFKGDESHLTVNCIRYPVLPLVHNGGVHGTPRENHFPTGFF